MNVATVSPPMTSDELFKKRPNKRVDRWLFRGELRETKVTMRNPSHSSTLIAVGGILRNWLQKRPKPRGKVYGGEVYFRIRKNPDTNVGIDVALSTPEQAAVTKKNAGYVDGPPVLAVEVTSPYDRTKDLNEMRQEYLACGVKLVWIVDPYAETVTVYRPDKKPVLFNSDQELIGEPHLPGFKVKVSEFFE